MGIPCLEFYSNKRIWSCKECGTHLANADDLVSNDFQGEFGRAKLFRGVSNFKCYDRREAHMTTGLFIIDQIRCRSCESYLGWTYIKSYSQRESYKVGKYILEVEAITM